MERREPRSPGAANNQKQERQNQGASDNVKGLEKERVIPRQLQRRETQARKWNPGLLFASLFCNCVTELSSMDPAQTLALCLHRGGFSFCLCSSR